MRGEKHLSFSLAVLFFSAGAYLLQEAVSHTGHYAEELVLLGALFSAFALAGMGWFLKLHTRKRALQRHMRRH